MNTPALVMLAAALLALRAKIAADAAEDKRLNWQLVVSETDEVTA